MPALKLRVFISVGENIIRAPADQVQQHFVMQTTVMDDRACEKTTVFLQIPTSQVHLAVNLGT